jgi:large subunit ribosomal protein L13
MKYTIDATGKKLGRVASEAAALLAGKGSAEYQRNVAGVDQVEITNVSKALISDKKKEQKFYDNFSGFAGGLKQLAMKRVIEKHGVKEVFYRAVYGMLPTNKLRSKVIKHLTITE